MQNLTNIFQSTRFPVIVSYILHTDWPGVYRWGASKDLSFLKLFFLFFRRTAIKKKDTTASKKEV